MRNTTASTFFGFAMSAVAAWGVGGCAVGSTPTTEEGAAASDVAAKSTETIARSALPQASDAGACVEPGRYVAEADVVTDTNEGGLVWQRAVDGTQRTQPEAAAYCSALTLGGHDGWRLPTTTELNALRLRPVGIGSRPDACIPSIDQSAFPSTPADAFWTSTTRPAGDALETGFDDGRTHPAPLDVPFYVRCVHDVF